MNRVVEFICYLFIVNLSLFMVSCKNTISIDTKNEPHNAGVPNIPARKWISQLFREAEALFQMDSTTNIECKKHFDLYRLHALNQSIWAIKMMESSEWPSVGLFTGRTDHLGDYDECLSISSYGINGKYCLAEIVYDYPHDPAHSKHAVEKPNQKVSIWEAMTMYRSNPVRVDRQKIKFAVCIPSSCRADDLSISLMTTLSPIFKNQGLDVSVHVYPTACKTNVEENYYSKGFYVVSCMFVFIFLLVISSTISDIQNDGIGKNCGNKKPNRISVIYGSFSLIKNYRMLKEVNPKTDLTLLHFIKVLNMIFMIYAHRFLHFVGAPKSNAEAVEQTWKWPRIEIIHADIVDVFFMVSGFLTFYCCLSSVKREGRLFVFLNVLSRWMRMIPVIGILVLYIMYIMPYTSEGPLWEDKVSNEVNKCKETWWVLLLAMNNLVKSDQMCLIVSWYVSVDIQLTLLGGILLLIFYKNKKLGIFAMAFTFVGSTMITFIIAYLNKFHGILRIYLSSPEDYGNKIEFTDFYIAPYTRVGPYLIGFIGAFVTKTLIERQHKFSAKQTWLLWVISLSLIEGTAHYGFLFYLFERENSENFRLENAIYAALNRSLFVLGYAILICVNYTSGLGILEKFFNWKGFIPLGRLTYSFYLTNMMVQSYHTYSQKQVTQSQIQMNMVWLIFGDIIWTYVIGFLLHLFIEAPIASISKLLRKELSELFGKTTPTKECPKEINVLQEVQRIETAINGS